MSLKHSISIYAYTYMLKLRTKVVRSLFFNLRSFHVESLLPRRRRFTTA